MLLLLIAQRASALDWLVAPSLRLRESYSDNALLAPPGQEKSDFITEIAPAIALIASGPLLQLHLDVDGLSAGLGTTLPLWTLGPS